MSKFNWKDVRMKYPEVYDGRLTRDCMSEEQEREFVSDCYEAYENGGFAKEFGTPYTGERRLVGMKFQVLGRVPELKDSPDGADLECLPMWFIQLENGEKMAAYPEEICMDERNNGRY